MRNIIISGALLAMVAGSAFAQTSAPVPMHAVSMTLSSSDIVDGGIIPDKHTAKAAPAQAVSPALSWTGAPSGTQSFALIMHDLDVVVGKTTEDNLHWLAFNIPGTATSLPQGVPTTMGTLADGTIQSRRGNPPNYAYGFSGPGAPAPIYHHYVIELWALDSKLALTETATRADVLRAMEGHVLDKGVLVGRFHR